MRMTMLAILCVLCVIPFAPAPAGATDSAAVKAILADPPREYATAPLWVWNDRLTEREVVGTLRDLAAQKVKQAFVHPRPGLMTPYLSDEWFRLWKAALREAEKLDMNIWIYDENSYPSGFAGGFVPEAMPESRGRGLHIREEKAPAKVEGETIGSYRIGEGAYLVARIARAGNSPWHGGRCYVDLLYPGVTQKFLEITLGAYEREIGGAFGKRVPGSFADEPEIRPAGGLPWTDDLPQVFEKRWGYPLLPVLPCLARQIGDWKKVRHDYYATLLGLFIDRWAKPYYESCERKGLEFTGHYWEHEWPNCVAVPDNMAMSAWQQRPGIDCLMNQYNEGAHAQFGNVRAVREIASLANQLGRRRTLCEVYGAGGWDLRFEDMKRIGDWLAVLGINTLDEHLSYITIRGARKRDHPQSFSYHEPWWEAYHVNASYLTRVCAAMSQGEEVNSILIIEPTTTAWLYQADAGSAPHLAEIGDRFQSLVVDLAKAQVECDLGCEDVIARHGSVDGKAFVVGKRRYTVVVIPPICETLDAKTMDLLEAYVRAGGKVLAAGPPPAMVDGRPSKRAAGLARAKNWREVEAYQIPYLAGHDAYDGFAVVRAENDGGILYHMRRRIDDGDIVFLTNSSIENDTLATIRARDARGIEKWNLETGKVEPYPFAALERGVEATVALPPCGSLLLFLSEKPREAAPAKAEAVKPIPAAGPPDARRIAPNVLTLDFVDVAAGGERLEKTYFYRANQFAFRKNGMDRNPWDSAVQFKDELISKTFPPESGFEATYRFAIEEKVPADLGIVIERPELYSITCNGTRVEAAPGTWWLDRAFGRIDIAGAARIGTNEVTIKASPFTILHEIEPAYVLGGFALRSTASGFVIAPDRPLAPGSWKEQGHPFYSAGVAYAQRFDIGQPRGRYDVRLGRWYGSVAKVLVNGAEAGWITHAPWSCDVTDRIKPGANAIEVIVIGTLKNTLGPHHGNPPPGSAWPSMFQRGPETGPPAGGAYSLVDYGLFEPFALEKRG
ncbi:MAG: hypothetical protein JXP34_18455 [Planctomycetes bacterium]|nr:hypothetical protein [Planctomycetota bacterium]